MSEVPTELAPYVQQTDVLQLADLKRQANQALEMLKDYPCDTDEQEQYFADLRVRSDAMFDGLEEKRTAVTKPLLAAKRGIDELYQPAKLWKQLSDLCMRKIQGRRQRLLEARQAAERAAFEAARQAREAQETAARAQAAAQLAATPAAHAEAQQQLATAQAVAAQQTAAITTAFAAVPEAAVAAGVGEGASWEADVDLEALRAYLPEAARKFVCIDTSYVKIFCREHAGSNHIPAIPHVAFKRVATVRRK